MAQPARHPDQAGKIYRPAVQSSASGRVFWNAGHGNEQIDATRCVQEFCEVYADQLSLRDQVRILAWAMAENLKAQRRPE